MLIRMYSSERESKHPKESVECCRLSCVCDIRAYRVVAGHSGERLLGRSLHRTHVDSYRQRQERELEPRDEVLPRSEIGWSVRLEATRY